MRPQNEKVIAIGIAGGSGAGKSTLARAVYESLDQSTNVAYLVHDNYYKDISHLSLEQRAETNFDHPHSLDTHLLIQHIRDLKQGKSVHVPNYDFSTHCRTKDVTILEPRKIILVEGILIFSEPDLVKELDVKIFVDAHSDIRLIRRVTRDTVERGRTAQQVMNQYCATVRPMHEMYVEPSKQVADIIVNTSSSGDFSVAKNMIVSYLQSEARLSSTVNSDITE